MAASTGKGGAVSGLHVPGAKLEGWRGVIVVPIAVHLVLFVVLNTRRVEVDFALFGGRRESGKAAEAPAAPPGHE